MLRAGIRYRFASLATVCWSIVVSSGLLFAGLAGAQEGPVLEVPAEQATLRTMLVPPQATDREANAAPSPHLVAIDPSVPSRHELFVFLPGRGIAPEETSFIVRQAAANGFSAIGLSYPTEIALQELCRTNTDDTCFEKIRLEVIDGVDRTPLVEVTRANSIESRLVQLLYYLDEQFPNEGWGAYVDDGSPRWTSLRLGGWSVGGGYTALMARDHEVARLCLLEAPIDLLAGAGNELRLPPWVAPAQMTPIDRYYGFYHLHSSSPAVELFPVAWSVFGFDRFGSAVDTDRDLPPYQDSHHLTTDAEPAGDSATHASVVLDRATPRTATGQLLFAPVWQYACFS